MLRAVQYHTIPLPKGWPSRARYAVIQVIFLARFVDLDQITRSGLQELLRRVTAAPEHGRHR
jgi:hypothetical protein